MKKYLIIPIVCLAWIFTEAQEERILPVAQEMPTLQDCDKAGDYVARRACSDAKIRELVAQNLKYPAEALAAQEDGYLVVQFVVDEKGKTSEYRVVEDPGFGLAEAAIEAVKKSGKWNAGKNMNKPVKVLMSVPVRFELPPMPDKVEKRPDVYVVVDEAPRFQGCPADSTAKQCTFMKVTEFTKAHLKYPEEASAANVSGTVVVKFIVDTDGSVTQPEVLEGIGSGCDAEALRLVQSMPPWSPGLVKGQKVKTEMTLPFKFAPPTVKE